MSKRYDEFLRKRFDDILIGSPYPFVTATEWASAVLGACGDEVEEDLMKALRENKDD